MKGSLIQRKRNRLGNFDYSKNGSYFLTVCALENRYQFGNILGDEIHLSRIGSIADTWWNKIPERFPGVVLGDFVVMPNHVHGIIILGGREASEGFEGREASEGFEGREASEGFEGREASEGLPYGTALAIKNRGGAKAAPSIPRIIHWFKTWTTNEYFRYMKNNFPGRGYLKLWHRSYYDHIIRSEADYQRISDYIRNNPANWKQDRFSWPENNPRSTR